ncbi:D-arabinono-1,4-lactone oxidase [Spelaeicoccus albus]|uniref:FAD-linked oxidoreductase n=1 Tax=Spelaeicoccus albus TaxID=1280376 RepID=A0A7Z0II66_9MICO|nr:D-arabinono-1,4-lactone oxidase [Spelaeicoccus albus]NYI68179.1 FAD-linked oxidoreductase [Spelaeicoccus albus]
MSALWRNWSGLESVTPARVVRPKGANETAGAVLDAVRDGLPVKAIGAGHSFTGAALAPGVQLDMSAMSGLVSYDPGARQVTVGAGTYLYDMPPMLSKLGLAMANLGDIDRQTVAGALSTGTHGTGTRFGGLATQATAMTVATADGELRKFSKTRDPREWPAIALAVGSLGVLIDVTIQCVPAFKLHAVEAPEPLDDVLGDFRSRCTGADHFEFYWFPHTATALTKTNTRVPVDAPGEALPGMRRWVDDEVVSNAVYSLTCRLGSAVPIAVPRINRLAGRLLGHRDFTDASSSVFTTPRRVRFREMEYALPREVVPDAVRRIRELIDSKGWRISFPVEVRTAAPDDLWLSTAYGRDTGYIAVHRYLREDHREYFAAVEDIFREFGGRPHWGKLHTRSAADLRELYPHFDDFLAVRDALDPGRVFANPYLRQIFGT